MTTATRAFLGFQVLVWLPYGLLCFFQPTSLADYASVTAGSATATTEIRAMYGGLQTAIGALCGLALWRRELVRPSLVMLFCLCLGLATSRAAGLLLDGSGSGYTLGALTFEIGNTACAYALLSSPKLAGTV